MTGYAVPLFIVLFGSIVAPRPGSSVAGDASLPCALASVGDNWLSSGFPLAVASFAGVSSAGSFPSEVSAGGVATSSGAFELSTDASSAVASCCSAVASASYCSANAASASACFYRISQYQSSSAFPTARRLSSFTGCSEYHSRS